MACVALVLVLDAVTKSVFGARELPTENAGSIRRVCHGGRITSKRTGRSIDTGHPVLGADFPVIICRVVVVVDSSEETLGPRKIARGRPNTLDGDKIFRAGHDEHVFSTEC